jgi:hypothetical protein
MITQFLAVSRKKKLHQCGPTGPQQQNINMICNIFQHVKLYAKFDNGPQISMIAKRSGPQELATDPL